MSVFYHLIHFYVGNGYQRTNIGSAHTRVLARVLAHVYELGCFFDGQEGGIYHFFGCSHKSNDRSVGRLSGVHIEQLYTLNAFNFICDLLNHIHIAALRKIRHTLN